MFYSGGKGTRSHIEFRQPRSGGLGYRSRKVSVLEWFPALIKWNSVAVTEILIGRVFEKKIVTGLEDYRFLLHRFR